MVTLDQVHQQMLEVEATMEDTVELIALLGLLLNQVLRLEVPLAVEDMEARQDLR